MQLLFIDGEPIEITTFETAADNSPSTHSDTIYCISPYMATPKQIGFRSSLRLDTNVMSRTTSTIIKENIGALLKWATERGMGVNLNAAVWELARTTPIDTCVGMIEECTRALRSKFGFQIPQKMWEQQAQYLYENRAQANVYITQLAEFLVVIKYFYHQPDAFDTKCRLFATFISEHLPFFRIAYLAGCLYLFSKQQGFRFESKVKRKWQSDMNKNPKAGNWSHARNVASDLAMVTFTTYMPFPEDSKALDIPYVATSDAGLAGLLSELAYIGIDITAGKHRIGHGIAGYRQGSIARETIVDITANGLADEFFGGSMHDDAESKIRLGNLSAAASCILDKNFEITLMDLQKYIANRPLA